MNLLAPVDGKGEFGPATKKAIADHQLRCEEIDKLTCADDVKARLKLISETMMAEGPTCDIETMLRETGRGG